MLKLKRVIAMATTMLALGTMLAMGASAASTVNASNSGGTTYSPWTTGGYAQGYAYGQNYTNTIDSVVQMNITSSTYPGSKNIVWNNGLPGHNPTAGTIVIGDYTRPAGNSTTVYQIKLQHIRGSITSAAGTVRPS